MPKVKIPYLGCKNYLPPEINKLDYIAIKQGKVENLECNCTECHEEEMQSIEIEEIQQTTVAEEATVQPEVVQSTSLWRQAISACKTIFQAYKEPTYLS